MPLAGFQSEGALTPDDGLVLSFTNSRQITLSSGMNLKRGSILGMITDADGIASAAPAGGNTGNATIGTLSLKTGAIAGTYVITDTDATHFTVTDPNGDTVGTGTYGVAFATQIGFTITAGATPSIAGDSFSMVVNPGGGGKYLLALPGAGDGSQTPCAILAEDCDASGGDKLTVAYMAGHFAELMCVYGTGFFPWNVREALRARGINLQSVIPR